MTVYLLKSNVGIFFSGEANKTRSKQNN